MAKRHRQLAAAIAVAGVLVGGAIANAETGSSAHKATTRTHRALPASHVARYAARKTTAKSPMHNCPHMGSQSSPNSSYMPGL